MPYSAERISRLSSQELSALSTIVLRELAARPDTDSFEALLAASQEAALCVGQSARLLAEHGSWSQVAQISGTSKQAAWSRWNQY